MGGPALSTIEPPPQHRLAHERARRQAHRGLRGRRHRCTGRLRLAALLLPALVAACLETPPRRPAPAPPPPSAAADLEAARGLFERNVAAIQRRDREAYLACYERSGQLVRAGAEGPGFGYEAFERGVTGEWPVQLIARDAKLHWLGPGLVWGCYRYRVISAEGPAREGLSERLFRKGAPQGDGDDGWRIVVTTAFEQPPGTPAPPCVLAGATVYDGGGGPPLRDAAIVVRGGRIEAIGPRAGLALPAGVEVIDLSGRFIVPGLIDTHVHYSRTGWADGRPDALPGIDLAAELGPELSYLAAQARLRDEPERFHRAFLHSGVTAVLDAGGYPWTRRLGEAAELSPDAPHVRATGPLLATWDPGPALALPDQLQFVPVPDAASVRLAVAGHAAQGSDAIKLWLVADGSRPPEELGAIATAAGEEARAAGLPLVAHATGLDEARLAVEAGASLLVHGVSDRPVDEAFVTLCRERGVFYCPTLTVQRGDDLLFERRIDDELRGQLPALDASIGGLVLRTPSLPPDPRDTPPERERRRARREREDRVAAANLLAMHRGGVRVVLGTGAGNPLTLHGPSVFPELEAMQAAGLEARAVLSAATRDAAAAIGRGDDLGLLAPGRVADLVVLVRDPGEDVAALRSINQVMRAGVLQQRGRLAGR